MRTITASTARAIDPHRLRARAGTEIHALVDAGVPVNAVDALKSSLGLTDAELAVVLGVSAKTLARIRAARGRLDPTATDRLFRAMRIVALAFDVLESEDNARQWLRRPQMGLGGMRPVSLLTTDAGTREVERLLLRIEHGVYT